MRIICSLSLARRVAEHRSGEVPGFTASYRCNHLVYYEEHACVERAIEREKILKGWARWKKERLIKEINPSRVDLAAEW